MTRDWKQWEGRVVNGTFPLRQYLGGSDHSVVFLTERRGRDPQKAAIKLITVDPENTASQLARWEIAAKLSHPHLLRLFETGSCQLDSVVLLYVVMEYAEENLAQILPQRPLTAAEARDMLAPTLEALAYIHGQSLVHGRLRPSNILATQDQLKMSSDTLVRIGDPIRSGVKSSGYDAPEIASGQISPASDAWSLGMTLIEALTQRLPNCEGMAEPVLETVPAPFMGVAHCCLRRDPLRRCTVADIATRLRSGSPSSTAQGPSTVRIPAASAKWPYILPLAAVGLLGAALLIGPKLIGPRQETQAAPVSSSESSAARPAETSSELSPGQQIAPPKSKPSPSTTETKPAARKAGKETPRTDVAGSSAAPASVVGEASAATVSGRPSVQGQVLQQIMPAVSKSARDTIHGTIKVLVKVSANPSGNVERATFVSAGPSKYFARQAMQAAQQWKFVPEVSGQGAPRTWILRFAFRRSGTEAIPEPAKP
jgi:TonB family protein